MGRWESVIFLIFTIFVVQIADHRRCAEKVNTEGRNDAKAEAQFGDRKQCRNAEGGSTRKIQTWRTGHCQHSDGHVAGNGTLKMMEKIYAENEKISLHL